MCSSQSCVYRLFIRTYVLLWVIYKMIHTGLKLFLNLSFCLVKWLKCFPQRLKGCCENKLIFMQCFEGLKCALFIYCYHQRSD